MDYTVNNPNGPITSAQAAVMLPDFQYQVLTNMLKDEHTYLVVSSWLKKEHLTRIECKLVLEALYDFRRKYEELPTLQALAVHLLSNTLSDTDIAWQEEHKPLITEVLAYISRQTVKNAKFYIEELKRFVREVTLSDALAAAQQQQFGNRAATLTASMQQYEQTVNMQVGNVIESATTNPEIPENEEDLIFIPTGIKAIDIGLNGGLSPTEFGMVTAPTGVGKTNTLLNFTVNAVTNGFRALFLTLELPSRSIKNRYEAMLMGLEAGVFFDHISKWPLSAQERHELFVHPQFKYSGLDAIVDCSKAPLTVQQIDGYVDMWIRGVRNQYGEEEAKKCKLVLVDWFGLIDFSNVLDSAALKDEWKKLEKGGQYIKRICNNHDVGIWVAAQTNRSGLNTEKLHLGAVAGSYNSNFALDINVGITRAFEDEDDLESPQYLDDLQTDTGIMRQQCDQDLIGTLMKIRSSGFTRARHCVCGIVKTKCYQWNACTMKNSSVCVT